LIIFFIQHDLGKRMQNDECRVQKEQTHPA
jgi:hypothetical protein